MIREHGIFGKVPFVQMRTPGFGDSDWTRVISELRLAGFKGAIDIEGWHDPVYRDDAGNDRPGAGAQLSEGVPGRRRVRPEPELKLIAPLAERRGQASTGREPGGNQGGQRSLNEAMEEIR